MARFPRGRSPCAHGRSGTRLITKPEVFKDFRMPSPESKAKIAPFPSRTEAPAAEKLGLTHRPRRNRKSEWARRLVRENVLTTDDLIWPIFVLDGEKRTEPVASMPGVLRYSVDEALRAAEKTAALSIPAIANFPYTDPDLRDPEGSEALHDQNL